MSAETPRTDEAAVGFARLLVDKETFTVTELVDANFARVLERELAAAQQENERLRAQEPVAWRYKERINCGQGQFIDSDWKLLPFRPILGGSSDGGCTSGITHLEPLYAAPPPDEAREWIALTDEDRQAAFQSMPDMLEGFLKTWGWLHFAKEIERRCREKNK